MLVTVKFFGVPDETDDDKLNSLMDACRLEIGRAMGESRPTGVAIFFPDDQFECGVGEEILAEVEIPTDQGFYDKALGQTQANLGRLLVSTFPESTIQIRVRPIPERLVWMHEPSTSAD